ncbi:MAG: hypothetical protein WC838_01710 [Candidatus Margulisiibacteriota bacterium]|jgi:polyhydroxyalkanoate synthesis regulator protein
MKKEYDFAKAEQGKYYRPQDQLVLPIYLEKNINSFYNKLAGARNRDLSKLINNVLKKEMEVIKAIG